MEDDIASLPNWPRSRYDYDIQNHQHDSPLLATYFGEPSLQSNPHQSLDFSPTSHYIPSNESHRNLLPWASGENPNRVTPETKEERLRMLEQEFGPKVSHAQRALELSSDELPLVIGSVDAKGNLVTAGPKKRIANRLLQAAFASGQFIVSLYSAVLLKPTSPPPPQGTAPAYGLYILSVLTILSMISIFVFRPCCCAGRRTKLMPHEGPGGMMVLPVQSLPGARNGKKTKAGKGKGKGEQQAIQVNLIVDPSMFGGGGRHAGDNEAEADQDGGSGQRRKGIFEGLREEEHWKVARAFLRKMSYYDMALMVLWGAEFVLMLHGKRCPTGQFGGWCEGYNVATALACLLVLTFGLNVFFDLKDLGASKASPRTRI